MHTCAHLLARWREPDSLWTSLGRGSLAPVAHSCFSSQESWAAAGHLWRSSEIPRDEAPSGRVVHLCCPEAHSAGLWASFEAQHIPTHPGPTLPSRPTPTPPTYQIKEKKSLSLSPSIPLSPSLSPCSNHEGPYSKDIMRSSKFLVRAMASSSRRAAWPISN